MCDRREQIGAQSFDVPEDGRRISSRAALDHLLAEAREHVGAVLATGDAHEPKRGELIEQLLCHAIPEIGAAIREAASEVSGVRLGRDQRQGREAQ